VSLLQDYAEISDGIDDALAAGTWRDIAAAAGQLLPVESETGVIRQAAE
jgi:hypothetical protein